MTINLDRTYVAVFDVLGFSDLAKNNDQGRLERVFDNMFMNSLQSALSYGQYHDKSDGTVAANLSIARVNSLSVSDTVMLWTKDDSPESFMDLFAMLGPFSANSFMAGMPLRGAVVLGPISVSMGQSVASTVVIQTRILGKSIVEAHDLQSLQSWSGCIFHPDAIKHYENSREKSKYNLPTLDQLLFHGFVLKYPVPIKRKGMGDYIALNWTMNTRNPLTEEEINQCFSLWNKSTIEERTKEIIRNTISFVNVARAPAGT